MIDELEPLRGVRRAAPEPSADARMAARSAWNGETVALTTAPARRSDRSGRRFAVRTAIALVAATAVVAGALALTRHRIDSVKPKHVEAVGSLAPADGGPQVFLLVGHDTRTINDPDHLVATGSRADTILLVRVDPGHHGAFAVSVPRDLFVDVPGCGTIKIDATYNPLTVCGTTRGGLQLLVQTITQQLDVPVDHVIEVGFRGFASLVDELGGIRVGFEFPTRDRYTGLNIDAGCHLLDGPEALSYVRARHVERMDPYWEPEAVEGDVGRMGRQQVALRALAKAAFAHAGSDPRPLLRALFAHVTVDSKFTSDDALRIFNALRNQAATATTILPLYAKGDGMAMSDGARIALSIVAGRTPAPRHLGVGDPAQTNESSNC